MGFTDTDRVSQRASTLAQRGEPRGISVWSKLLFWKVCNEPPKLLSSISCGEADKTLQPGSKSFLIGKRLVLTLPKHVVSRHL